MIDMGMQPWSSFGCCVSKSHCGPVKGPKLQLLGKSTQYIRQPMRLKDVGMVDGLDMLVGGNVA
jgi:hypothetical protein